MKFILVFSICSAITGFCNNPTVVKPPYNSWTDCVVAGSELTIAFAKRQEELLNTEKLYISYFCNENHSDKTPT